jgi:predicted ABC-type ATPase
MNDIIGINHYAFTKDRFILESVVSAHEIVHSVKQSSSSGVVLKLDYEKAFDTVDLDFPLDIIKKRGFG